MIWGKLFSMRTARGGHGRLCAARAVSSPAGAAFEPQPQHQHSAEVAETMAGSSSAVPDEAEHLAARAGPAERFSGLAAPVVAALEPTRRRSSLWTPRETAAID